MLPKFSQIVNRLYAFIYETNHSKSGLGLPSIVALGWDPRYKIWVEDDPDIIHFDNSSDLPLSTSLNDLDNATLHIDGQSTVVDAPPDIIDVPDEDDDIIGDEDALPHDLADSDVEDHINMSSADVARRPGGHVPRPLWRKSRISIFSFGMIPGTLPEPLKIGKTGQRARSYLDRDPGRLLAFEMRWQSSATQEYPSLIDTFFVAHTVNGVFTRDEDRLIYEEMRRLKATGTLTMRSIAWLEEVSSEGTFPVSVGHCQHGSQPAQVGLRLKARSRAYTKR
ncbi:hypothetical protein Tco_0888027 [Tanacetum coccineum]